ncbi:MAG: alpha-galactosidase [Bacilli bacterium]|nr:alpha-galactosidase [Bacilli bacterium]
MRNKTLSFTYNGMNLTFEISKEKICLLHFGLNERIKRIKASDRQFFRFVEAEYLGGNENKHRGLKLNDTSYGLSAKFVAYEENESDKGLSLTITTKNDVLEIESHFLIYKNAHAVSCYNIAKNISNKTVELLYVPSFFFQGVASSNNPGLSLYQASNSWHCEAQWSKFGLRSLGVFNGNDFTSMKRYCLNNTGTWSTKEHLPMIVLEDRRGKSATLVQIENNGSWHIEIGDFANYLYLAACGPEFYDNSWSKKLKKGETFRTTQATLSFGADFEESVQEITKARRAMRRECHDYESLPVIFNDYMHALWDTQTKEAILPLVDIASKVGCDEFCIDAGWFAKGSTWWNSVGEWKECEENFPNGGLKSVIDYIHSKGMKAGIWFEIEAVGLKSSLVDKAEDGWFFQIKGNNVVNNERLQLNFDNPEVYAHAMNVIDRAMKLYSLDYMKIDYNFDAGVGNDWNSDSLGDGLLKHNRAYIKWLNEVMDKYPSLTIENCGSGGCRMDYEILKYCPIQSTSDQTNYRKYPYLSANVLTACTPEQAAVWSYPVSDYEKTMPSDEVVIMNMCNAMLGRIHLASFINKLSDNQLELIKEGISFYKSIVDMKKESVPFFPKGTATFFDKEVSGGLTREKDGILGVWNTSGKPRTVKVKLSKYAIKEIEVGYPKNIDTDFVFDKESGVLQVNFKEGYGGRIFAFEKE